MDASLPFAFAVALSEPIGDRPRWPPSHTWGSATDSVMPWACASLGANTAITTNANDATNDLVFRIGPSLSQTRANWHCRATATSGQQDFLPHYAGLPRTVRSRVCGLPESSGDRDATRTQ